MPLLKNKRKHNISSQSQELEKFEVGSFVFAKIKGYSPWPSKVIKLYPANKKCEVYYYGSNQTGYVYTKDLLEYSTNKDKFSSKGGFLRHQYTKAFQQIEAAIADPNTDLAPQSVQETDDDQKKSSQLYKAVEVKPIPVDFIKDESEHIVVDKKVRQKRKQPIKNSQTTKTKRPQKSPKIDDIKTETIIQQNFDSTEFEDFENLSTSELVSKLFSHGTLEYILMPDDRVIGIKYDYNLPNMFSSNVEHLNWSKKAYSNILMLKKQLENGDITIENIAKNGQLLLDPKINEESLIDLKIDYRQRRASKILQEQTKLFKLSYEIKLYLLDPYKESKFISKLLKYSDLALTPLIMKKNVDCIETIKSLQNYNSTGSLENATKIRNIAKKLYKKFQNTYGMEDDSKFWTILQEDALIFNEKVEKYSTIFVRNMVKEPEDLDEIDIAFISKWEKGLQN